MSALGWINTEYNKGKMSQIMSVNVNKFICHMTNYELLR